MKRKIDFSKVTKIFPIFTWTICHKCGYEFLFRFMWSLEIFNNLHYFICTDCAKSKEGANKIRQDIIKELEDNRPEPPPRPTGGFIIEGRTKPPATKPSTDNRILKFLQTKTDHKGPQ